MTQAIHLSGRPTSPQGQALPLMLCGWLSACASMCLCAHVCTCACARVWVLIDGNATKNPQVVTSTEEKASGWD